jgi:multiple sugar transport system ATP-binding protein
MVLTMVRLESISKSFKKKRAVRDLNLVVSKGEVFVLLGPTGAGKTTTLRLTAGLERPDVGRIFISDEDVTNKIPWGRDIAFVFEGLNLLPMYTVYDNIAFALRSPIYRESETEIRSRVEKVARDLRIDHLLDRKPATLSGGEIQRVAVARALVRRPRLYLLDEPLSNLDLKLREELRAELKALLHEYESTILYATHDYIGAVSIGDRIGILYEGQLNQVGTQEELHQRPATTVVATLMGNPAMNLISVGRDGQKLISSQDPRLVFEFSERQFIGLDSVQGELLLGIWPEDLKVSLQPQEGFFKTRIYGLEYRGTDRIISLAVGEESLKKMVAASFSGRYGEDCWFSWGRDKIYLFDRQTGKRVN